MVSSVFHEEVKSRIRQGLEKHLPSVFKLKLFSSGKTWKYKPTAIGSLSLLEWEEFISTYVDVETWRTSN